MPPPEPPPGAAAGSSGTPSGETYTYGHSPVVVAVHEARTAEREAAFFLPRLRPGMRLLLSLIHI